MSKKVLLLHGWGGSDSPHWQANLASALAQEYGCVNFLRFSNFDAPKLDVWKKELQEALEDFKPDIVICHSLANTLWFHLANTTTLKTITQLYLVAPPSMNCKVQEIEEFFPCKTPKNLFAKEVLLIGSSNDPYMSMQELQKLQKELGVELKVLQNAGHINADSGFGEWPWMLSELKSKLFTSTQA
ncbi:alpha/beta hydrolase [Sulfurimonas sp. SAG-AH-194-C20]|nr:alpha/beta hydrolase [Sulfurimonas sp. SAG-AH-194-C20]MDF1878080.1 alpha/beta hydrolase [Sulfurimonas sp. SAG-AH-194-C20]